MGPLFFVLTGNRAVQSVPRRLFPTAFSVRKRYNIPETGAVTTVVYIDSVFVLNAATDYLLLLMTARLAGLVPRRGRYLLAACVGGFYAAAAWLPGWAFLTAAPVKCAAGVGLCLIAFGSEDALGRLTLLFFTVSCVLAGGVLALDLLTGTTGTSARTFLLTASGAWLLLAVFFRTAARNHAAGTLLPVRVCVGGRVTDLTALLDSGNALTDGGYPALVLSAGILPQVFPASVASLLTGPALRSPPDLLPLCMERMPSLRPRLLPYHAVGVPSGLLLSVESDWAEVNGLYFEGLRLALSPTGLGHGYAALWGGPPGKNPPQRGKPPTGENPTQRGKPPTGEQSANPPDRDTKRAIHAAGMAARQSLTGREAARKSERNHYEDG